MEGQWVLGAGLNCSEEGGCLRTAPSSADGNWGGVTGGADQPAGIRRDVVRSCRRRLHGLARADDYPSRGSGRGLAQVRDVRKSPAARRQAGRS